MTSRHSLLLVGATGAVGTAVLEQALEWREIRSIVAPTRRPLSRRAAKLDDVAMVSVSDTSVMPTAAIARAPRLR